MADLLQVPLPPNCERVANGRGHTPGAGANGAKGGGIYPEQGPTVRREGVYTRGRDQRCEGRGHTPGTGANGAKGGGIYLELRQCELRVQASGNLHDQRLELVVIHRQTLRPAHAAQREQIESPAALRVVPAADTL
eukprot:1177256-Prorocentrum_minimum.AAC.5